MKNDTPILETSPNRILQPFKVHSRRPDRKFYATRARKDEHPKKLVRQVS